MKLSRYIRNLSIIYINIHNFNLLLLQDHFNKQKKVLNLKYIDPTYMIRAIPSIASDNVNCTLLAQSAIHGAMAGYTGFTISNLCFRWDRLRILLGFIIGVFYPHYCGLVIALITLFISNLCPVDLHQQIGLSPLQR
ncbi:hypothetical protein CsSME_00007648 [Camellia sinensis var. sinensis]